MTRYNIYIGLNDKETHKQLYDTEKYVAIMKHVCQSYRVSFSFAVADGGYIYEDGSLVNEKTLYLSLFNQDREKVKEIVKDLCTFFNQESVMVTESEIKMYFLPGDREVLDAMKEIKSEKGENE